MQADHYKAAFNVREFCRFTSLGRTKVYQLIRDGEIETVKCGKRTLITTTPAEFVAGLANHKDSMASRHADVAA